MTPHRTPDHIIDLMGATCQHGPYNQRIYLMNLGSAAPEAVIPALDALAKANQYTKIFAKVPADKVAPFYRAGYLKEAEVPGFFRGEETALFVCRYFDEKRQVAMDAALLDEVIASARARQQHPRPLPALPENLEIRICTPDDVDEMSRLYRQLFPSYPFPIQDPDYLSDTMRSHVVYFAVETGGEIVALSSSEMDEENRNVEMTDFATRPDQRGQKLATHLLNVMEEAMQKRSIACAYTIARAASFPINITFSSSGYAFGGRLINNTNISGQIESMTVWYKALLPCGK
jgi:beta-lysine N6-acetyltransferase